jgi:hypothetical protein
MTLKQIIKDQNPLMRLRNKLEREHFLKKALPALEKLVGRYFVYRKTCYSCPEKHTDYWDVFRRVLRIVVNDGAAWIVYEEASIDSRGCATIRTGSEFVNNRDGFGSGWQACEPREFSRQYAKTLDALSDPRQLCEFLEAK